MLDVLARTEQELPQLLSEPGWHSLDIDYHPPRVERIWRQRGDYRISLHRIHTCAAEQALFHPHPWPSAMRVLAGKYEMAVGYGAGLIAPPIAARLIADSGLVYEMTDPDAWHYVRPLSEHALTVMVTGRPWDRVAPEAPSGPLKPLGVDHFADLMRAFRRFYSFSA